MFVPPRTQGQAPLELLLETVILEAGALLTRAGSLSPSLKQPGRHGTAEGPLWLMRSLLGCRLTGLLQATSFSSCESAQAVN